MQYEGIRVLHDLNHWVAIACIDGKVILADSMHNSISLCVGYQMKQLYASMTNQLENLLVSVVPLVRRRPMEMIMEYMQGHLLLNGLPFC